MSLSQLLPNHWSSSGLFPASSDQSLCRSSLSFPPGHYPGCSTASSNITLVPLGVLSSVGQLLITAVFVCPLAVISIRHRRYVHCCIRLSLSMLRSCSLVSKPCTGYRDSSAYRHLRQTIIPFLAPPSPLHHHCCLRPHITVFIRIKPYPSVSNHILVLFGRMSC